MCVYADALLNAPGRLQAQEAHLWPYTRQNEEVFNRLWHIPIELQTEVYALAGQLACGIRKVNHLTLSLRISAVFRMYSVFRRQKPTLLMHC